MAGEDFETHWQLLAWAVDTLLNLSPGEYPPISYEQTYSAVYKCVCQGYAEDLYQRLLGEMGRQLKLFGYRLQASSGVELIEAFDKAWQHFNGGINGIVPIFNYMARFYVETKLNLNLRLELMKIFDQAVVQPICDRLIGEVRSSRNSLQRTTMENILRALYAVRPDTLNELPDLYRHFVPDLLAPAHSDELPDLQDDSRHHTIVKGPSTVECQEQLSIENWDCAAFDRRISTEGRFVGDMAMDFEVPSDDAMITSASDQIQDPQMGGVTRRMKRPLSNVDSEDERDETMARASQSYPDEPSQSPRSLESYWAVGHNSAPRNTRARKYFHRDNGGPAE